MPALEITTIIGCENACSYCPQKLLTKQYAKTSHIRVMTLSFFKSCLDTVPKDVNIHFSGFAEPFQNPQCIEMLDYAYQRGHKIVVFTTLSHSPIETLKKLIDKKIDLNIHLPHKESGVLKASHNSLITTKILFLKASKIPFTAWKVGEFEFDKTIKDIIGSNYKKQPVISRAGNVGNGSKVKFPILCQGARQNQNVLMPNGDVYLCCQDYGLKHRLGNLLQDNYTDLHNGKEYCKIIDKMLTGGDILCSHCERAVSI
jgi:radical SAM protein with 4Fe4S-binding SPASM domain